MKKRVYNFNLPDELRDYLKEKANFKHTTISGYLIKLINQDKKDWEEIFTVKESVSVEGNIVSSVVRKVITDNLFETIELEKLESEISKVMDKFIKMDYKIKVEEKDDRGIAGQVFFKTEDMENFKCVNVDVIPTTKYLLDE